MFVGVDAHIDPQNTEERPARGDVGIAPYRWIHYSVAVVTSTTVFAMEENTL